MSIVSLSVFIACLAVVSNAWVCFPAAETTRTTTTRTSTALYISPLYSKHSFSDNNKDEEKNNLSQSEHFSAMPPPVEKHNDELPQQDEDSSSKGQTNTTAAVLKKIRVSKAQAEIDQILSGPNAPMDLEVELKRVVHMAPPVPDNSPVDNSSAATAAAEQDLYAAVKRQDYTTAAAVQRHLQQQHVDDCGAVLQANAAFYRAFSQRNYDAMCDLWCHDNTITCIHPASTAALTGSQQVLQSWKRLLQDRPTGTAFSATWMEPAAVRVSVKSTSWAVVSCTERVYVRRFRRGLPKETRLVNQLLATNVFAKVHDVATGDTRWKLAHHHATWHPDSVAGKAAWRALRGGRSNSNNNNNDRDDDRDDDDDMAMQGIVGLDQLRADLGTSSSSSSRGGSARRQPKPPNVIRLADLLGSDPGDIFKKGGKRNSSNSGSNSQNNNPNEFLGGIINIRRISSDDMENDDDDDDMEYLDFADNDFVDDDEDEDEDGPNMHAIQSVQDVSSSSSTKNGNRKGSSQEVSADLHQAMTQDVDGKNGSNNNNNSMQGKDVLRQSCIGMLRKLTQQGTLSPRQKQILLTDIIYCSANGEFSMVEVAYELLCAEGEDDESDVAQEDFAEQCRVFATSLERSSPNGGHPLTNVSRLDG